MKRTHCPDPVAAVRTLFDGLQAGEQVYLGIDNGLEGALAFLPTNRTVAPVILDMPLIHREVISNVKGKKKKITRNSYDYWTLNRWFDPMIEHSAQVTVAIELGQPRPKDTAKTAFSIGMGYGQWQLFLAAYAIRWDEIRPLVWKRAMGLLKQDKDASRALALRLFPEVADYLAAKGDDGRAEALLLAEYTRRKHNGAASVADAEPEGEEIPV